MQMYADKIRSIKVVCVVSVTFAEPAYIKLIAHFPESPVDWVVLSNDYDLETHRKKSNGGSELTNAELG